MFTGMSATKEERSGIRLTGDRRIRHLSIATNVHMNAIVDSFQTVAATTPVANTVVAEGLWLTTKMITTQFVTLKLKHVPGQVRTRVKRLYVLVLMSICAFWSTLDRV
jgi:hypothetical protein